MSSSINKKTIEKKLKEHYEKLSKSHLSDFFNEDTNRGEFFCTKFSNLFIDFDIVFQLVNVPPNHLLFI